MTGGGDTTPATAVVLDAAWCYPEPTAGRENIKNHVTFATGKGITIAAAVSSLATAKKQQVHFQDRTAATAIEKAGTPRDGHDPHPRTTEGLLPLSADGSGPMDRLGSAAAVSFAFDPSACSARFLNLSNHRKTVSCHTNCSRPAQGSAFLAPAFVAGRRYRVRVAITAKPGRMCYFLGMARSRACFDVDSGQEEIRQNSFSLENLYAGVHRPRQPCATKAPPCFHQGSIVTMEIDLAAHVRTLTFSGLSRDKTRVINLGPGTGDFRGFVSLFNRAAEFTLVEAVEVLQLQPPAS